LIAVIEPITMMLNTTVLVADNKGSTSASANR
jgi:hypothetical protein